MKAGKFWETFRYLNPEPRESRWMIRGAVRSQKLEAVHLQADYSHQLASSSCDGHGETET